VLSPCPYAIIKELSHEQISGHVYISPETAHLSIYADKLDGELLQKNLLCHKQHKRFGDWKLTPPHLRKRLGYPTLNQAIFKQSVALQTLTTLNNKFFKIFYFSDKHKFAQGIPSPSPSSHFKPHLAKYALSSVHDDIWR
jgi:hypothetical protein